MSCFIHGLVGVLKIQLSSFDFIPFSLTYEKDNVYLLKYCRYTITESFHALMDPAQHIFLYMQVKKSSN